MPSAAAGGAQRIHWVNDQRGACDSSVLAAWDCRGETGLSAATGRLGSALPASAENPGAGCRAKTAMVTRHSPGAVSGLACSV